MLKPKESTATGSAACRLHISSEDPQYLRRLQTVCEGVSGLQVSASLSDEQHCDPLRGVDPRPDILMLHVGSHGREALAALLQLRPSERPALLVVGALDGADSTRLAMQAGARDLLPDTLDDQELRAAVQRIQREYSSREGGRGQLVAVINAKGGSGATLIAANLAHQLSLDAKVLLLDLDLQFGSAAHYLDVTPTHSHVEVLQQSHDLDGVALTGFCARYSDNLYLLGGRAHEWYLPFDVEAEQLETLLTLARQTFDFVVVDLPRHIDHLSSTTLEQADQVLMVLEQSVSHLRDATRLLGILRDDIGVQENRLIKLINRYSKAAPVTLEDIEEALPVGTLMTLPNDFKVVSESQNAGIPLRINAPHAPITLALVKLAHHLHGERPDHHQGLLARTVGRLFGRRDHA
ncbi:AAA family ATPase [Pseudomonas sp. NW5]|uniref:AAA family ATPase n=1 Tax=Pseudomonas sp. NW5 TaxID=2934934 RepID=UPI002022828E|nr:AAA family ATPase [Pseudomonas sp. NW5]MCL7461220.1 AAA family ATPase [Pseudomonas sp. NW5]